MALAGALCFLVHAVSGFTNRSLRGLVAGLFGTDDSSGQILYLRWRRSTAQSSPPAQQDLHPHARGTARRVFYIKLDRRLLRPLLEADKPSAPLEVRRALGVSDKALADFGHNRAPRQGSLKLVTTSRVGSPE